MNTSALCTSLHRACIIALTAMVASPTAQAADTTLMLTCKGTLFDHIEGKAQPPLELTPFGVVANLTARTLEGFPIADPFPVKITVANQATIQFEGSETMVKGTERIPPLTRRLTGTIDRVTGEVSATFTMGTAVGQYALKCRPTQGMF